MSRLYYVYIMASARNGTLYIGVTNHIGRRVWEHREGLIEGFTKKYGVTLLVWFEVTKTFKPPFIGKRFSKNGSGAGR